MQKVSLNYTKSYKNAKLKYLFEAILALITLPLFFIFIFVFFFRKIVFKKEIFQRKTIESKSNFEVFYFNSENFFITRLPLIFWILNAQISLVGTSLDRGYKMGVFNLWQVRENIKMSNQTPESCDLEYLEKQGFFYDLKLLFKAFFSMLFRSRNSVYKELIDIFGIKFHNDSLENSLKFMKTCIDNKVKKTLFFVNAHCLNLTFSNREYKKSLQEADYILADGSGVNLACNILNTPLKQNLNGTDLLPNICKLAVENSYKIYLLGAQKGVALKMKKNLQKRYKNLKIVGVHDGYFKNEEEVIADINSKEVDILLVALGAPMQELFIQKKMNKIDAKLFMAVGGLFDFYSNRIKRAPLFLRELGLEWIYRLLQEPKRMFKRYIFGNPLFLYRVFKYKRENLQKVDAYIKRYNSFNSKDALTLLFWKYALILKKALKRVLDIVISFILLIFFTPLFLVVAIIIRVESTGAVIFAQTRVGKEGKLFKMYKFRSMVQNADELKKALEKNNESKDGVTFKMKEDPRITSFGKIIRKTSIDELPQLYNVFIGDMSLVGPRPPVISEVEQYNFNDRKRLDVKPGITCIWQVSGRSKIPFKQQVEMDKEYIKEQSFFKDITLLFKTIPAVLFSKGAY